MNISKESTGDLTATVKIELVKEDYNDAVTKVLKDYQRKANMPGFRQGKVPFGIVKKLYGKSVMADEVNKVLSESLNNYITENNINFVGNPLPNAEKTEQIDFDTQEEFTFYFDLGLSPEFEIELNDKIKVDKYDIEADEEVVNNYLNDMRKRQGNTINPETADLGDILKGDIAQLDEEGNTIEGGVSNETSLAVDFIKLKTIQKKFIGAKVGKAVKFNPLKATKNETETASMLGIQKTEEDKLNADYQFTIKEISRIEEAELNEEFFKQLYPQEEITTEEDLRAKIKEDAETSFGSESDKKFMNDAMETIIDKAKLSLPDEFLKRWLVETNEQLTNEEVEGQYDMYSKTFKWQLVENKIMTKYDVRVEQEEVKDQIRKYFMQPGQELDEEMKQRMEEIVNQLMSNQEETKRIYDDLLNKKMADLFKDKIKVNNKAITYQDFIKLATKTQ